jgi:hypothetical protein
MQQLEQQRLSQGSSSPPTVLSPGQAVSLLQSTPTTCFGMQDMALLHHWTTSTSLNIFNSPESSAFWQVMFPNIAFKHPFVMHAILSLAALHLAYINRSEKNSHMVDAARHHTQAVKGFQEVIGHVSNTNSDALFIWSLLNLLYVFGISGRLSDDVEENGKANGRKDRILGAGWIPMIRGIEAVLQPTHNLLKTGPLAEIMSVGNWFELDPDKSPTVDDEYLRQARSSWERSIDVQTYDEALRILRKSKLYMLQFKSMDAEALGKWGCHRSSSGPFMFIHFAPQAFFELLHQRQPPALILFAFFGALLHTLDDCWLMEGWGRDIVEVVDDLLGSYWRSWITWPAQVVRLDWT